MEFKVTNKLGEEQRGLKEIKYLDIDCGDTNEFNWQVRDSEYDKEIHSHGCRIFAPGTEFGGIIQYSNPLTASSIVKLRGPTWRGIIDKEIVRPPAGSDYLIVSGEANTVLAELFQNRYENLIRVSTEDSGFTISNHQVNRYVHMLAACKEILDTVGARLSLSYQQGEPNGIGYVLVSAVPVEDYTGSIEFSEDGKLNYNIVSDNTGINHLICLGKGELKDRLVVDLYLWPDGSVKRTRYYNGLDERIEIYDYNTIDNETELVVEGTKKLNDLKTKDSFKVYVSDDVTLELGDIVGGRDRITNTLIQAPVIDKIYKRQGASEHITYKLEGEDS